jgi:hypothetical protein
MLVNTCMQKELSILITVNSAINVPTCLSLPIDLIEQMAVRDMDLRYMFLFLVRTS